MEESRNRISNRIIKRVSDFNLKKAKDKSSSITIIEFHPGNETKTSNQEMVFTSNSIYFFNKKFKPFKDFGKNPPMEFNKRLMNYSIKETDKSFEVKFELEKLKYFTLRFGGDQIKYNEFKTFFEEWLQS